MYSTGNQNDAIKKLEFVSRGLLYHYNPYHKIE